MSGAAAYTSLLTPKLSDSPYTPGIDSTQNTPYFDGDNDPLRYESEKPTKTWFGYGWRGGARIAFCTVVTVFVINLTLLIYLTLAYPRMDGFPVVFRGSCKDVTLYNRLWHVLINVLSTGLLSSSNYCMQLLVAPTRGWLDKAHANGHWLDIGIPSIRNLRFLPWKRRGLWLLLCISSIPLHLVYNSTFYSAIAANEYNILYAKPDFLTGAAYDTTRFPDSPSQEISNFQKNALNTTMWTRLDNRECIRMYGEDFVTGYRNVVAVVSDNVTSSTGSLLDVQINDYPDAREFNIDYQPFAWICNDTDITKYTEIDVKIGGQLVCQQQLDKLVALAESRWVSDGYHISYCMAEIVPGDCHLHFAPHLMGPVVLMNIVKVLVAFYVAFRMADAPLVTLGDAIQSFIKEPDATTVGMCLLTAREASKIFDKAAGRIAATDPRPFTNKRERWHKVVSRRQWVALTMLLVMMVCGLALGLYFGMSQLRPANLSNAFSIGLGAIKTQNLVLGVRVPGLYSSAVLITALIANSPQLALSFLYLVYNTIVTQMHLGEDWDLYGAYTETTRHKVKVFSKKETHRRLRVADPKGQQKSTYMLSLPLRFAIPLLIISGIMHWLMSLTFFLANISVIPRDGNSPRHDEVTAVAYAPQGMFYLFGVSVFMVVVLAIFSVRKFGGEMHIVGSNSAAISAACHVGPMPERRRREMVLRRIAWGELPAGGVGARVPTMILEEQMQSGHGLGIERAMHKPQQGTKFTTTDFRDDEGDETDYGMTRGGVEMVDIDGKGIGRSSSTTIGHCGFSDGFVFKPEVGKFYA